LRDEARILIFDDPAELESWQRPHLDPSKIYEIPRARAARVRCASTLSINSIVLLNLVVVCIQL
jgi:hypothetical protein